MPPPESLPVKPSIAALEAGVAADGYAFLRACDMRALLTQHNPAALADWPEFVASWNDLRMDTYMADGGRYRSRRHGTFSAATGSTHVHREAHQPYYQSVDYNRLHGGIERWFEPIADEVACGPTMNAIFAFCCTLFGALKPLVAWHIEVHQFRIEARAGASGKPT